MEHRPSTTVLASELEFGLFVQLQFSMSVLSPAVPGASPLSLPLGIPPQSLPSGVVWRSPQGVTNPAPFSSQKYFTYGLLFPSLPKLLIMNSVSHDIELFHQKFFSHKSVKDYATMPLGIMGSYYLSSLGSG